MLITLSHDTVKDETRQYENDSLLSYCAHSIYLLGDCVSVTKKKKSARLCCSLAAEAKHCRL